MITRDCLIKCVVMIKLKNMKNGNGIRGVTRLRPTSARQVRGALKRETSKRGPWIGAEKAHRQVRPTNVGPTNFK
jgi:hypothetical protein